MADGIKLGVDRVKLLKSYKTITFAPKSFGLNKHSSGSYKCGKSDEKLTLYPVNV